MRIHLPKIKESDNRKAHPYPIQIGYQTSEFIQGYVFFYSILDESAGHNFQSKNSIDTLKTKFINSGLSGDAWELGWNIVAKYSDIFKLNVFQNVVISMQINWDWYISKLGAFIKYCELEKNDKTISNNSVEELNKIGFKKISEQLGILKKATQIEFEINDNILKSVRELSLLRNLGLHNRWEVDEYYSAELKSDKFKLGEIREININELNVWRANLQECISKTMYPIAIKYVDSPEYKDGL